MNKHLNEFLKKLTDSYYEHMLAVQEDSENEITWIIPIKKMLNIYWSKIDGGIDYIRSKDVVSFELDRLSISNHINKLLRDHRNGKLYNLRNYEAKPENIRYDNDFASYWSRLNLNRELNGVGSIDNIQIWLTKK